MHKFDMGRQMDIEEELKQKIVELELVLQQQELKIFQQLQQQTQQINLQEQHELQRAQEQQQLQQAHQQQQQQLQPQNFLLTRPKDIIQEFRQIKPLGNNRCINAFIKSVEMLLGLCGNNAELIEFGIQIIVNGKITADFGTYIREMGDVSWEQLKAKLRVQARPKISYAEVFNNCRYVKVSRLRELFKYSERAKHLISEIYEFDDNKSLLYKSENVDRDLVNILIEKIDGPFRIHLEENLTLNDIIVNYTKLGLLDNSRAIDSRHRANRNFKSTLTQSNYNNYGNQSRPQNLSHK